MAHAGQVLDNRAGERIVFRRTAADTAGELLEFEASLAPGAPGPPPHMHLHQTEVFSVLSGTMDAVIGEWRTTLGEGQQAVVEPSTRHAWSNAGEDHLQVSIELRPAGRFEDLLERTFAAMSDAAGI